jgi:hypothetical protein
MHIDKAIQDQDKDLHDLLHMFKQANSKPLSSFILQTPKHKMDKSGFHLKQPPF